MDKAQKKLYRAIINSRSLVCTIPRLLGLNISQGKVLTYYSTWPDGCDIDITTQYLQCDMPRSTFSSCRKFLLEKEFIYDREGKTFVYYKKIIESLNTSSCKVYNHRNDACCICGVCSAVNQLRKITNNWE